MSVEDTIIQVRDRAGIGWADYARTDRASALAALAAGRLPGHSDPEELRAVDWITKEEIVAVTTRTARTQAQEKVADTKTRSDANGSVPESIVAELREARSKGTTLAELRKLHPDLSAATIKAAVAGVEAATKAKRAPVASKRVEPVEPKRDQFGKGTEGTKAYRAAHAAYETALEAFRAGETVEATVTEPGQPAKRVRVQASKAKATDSKAKIAPAADDGVDWDSKAVANRIVKMKQDGQTIKQIAEAMDLPAIHRSWLRVSTVWRREADARGLDRPRHSAETVAKRVATRRAS